MTTNNEQVDPTWDETTPIDASPVAGNTTALYNCAALVLSIFSLWFNGELCTLLSNMIDRCDELNKNRNDVQV